MVVYSHSPNRQFNKSQDIGRKGGPKPRRILHTRNFKSEGRNMSHITSKFYNNSNAVDS